MKDNKNVLDASGIFNGIREENRIRAEIPASNTERLINIDVFFNVLDKTIEHKNWGLQLKMRMVIVKTIRMLCEMEWMRQTGKEKEFQMAVQEVIDSQEDGL